MACLKPPRTGGSRKTATTTNSSALTVRRIGRILGFDVASVRMSAGSSPVGRTPRSISWVVSCTPSSDRGRRPSRSVRSVTCPSYQAIVQNESDHFAQTSTQLGGPVRRCLAEMHHHQLAVDIDDDVLALVAVTDEAAGDLRPHPPVPAVLAPVLGVERREPTGLDRPALGEDAVTRRTVTPSWRYSSPNLAKSRAVAYTYDEPTKSPASSNFGAAEVIPTGPNRRSWRNDSIAPGARRVRRRRRRTRCRR